MPKAVASLESKRYDLKSLPGGWVELRKLAYGEVIARRELSTVMSSDMTRDNREMKMGLNLRAVALYELEHCVIDHNLEDENGEKLNLTNAEHVMKLDPKVAQEIEGIIFDMNQPEDDRPLPEPSGALSRLVAAPELKTP